MTDSGSALEQQIFDLAQRARIADVHHHREADHLGRAFMEPELLEAPEIVPPEGAPAPEFVPPCEDEVIRLYDRIWTNLLR